MIDQATFDRFNDAVELSKRMGASLPEVLDARDLLLTRKRRHQLQMQVLEDLLRRLALQSPNKLMSYYIQRPEGTAAEMFAAIQEWVETVVRAFDNGTLGDL